MAARRRLDAPTGSVGEERSEEIAADDDVSEPALLWTQEIQPPAGSASVMASKWTTCR